MELNYCFICTKCKKYGGHIDKTTNFVDIVRSKAFLLAHHNCWDNPSDLIDIHKRNCCIVRADFVPQGFTNDEAEKFAVDELRTFKSQIEEDIENYPKEIDIREKSTYN